MLRLLRRLSSSARLSLAPALLAVATYSSLLRSNVEDHNGYVGAVPSFTDLTGRQRAA